MITVPFLFDELFELFGKTRADYVTFVPLDPWYRFYFQNGTTFDYGGTIEDTLQKIREIEPRDADGYLALLEHSRKLYESGFTRLADQPFHKLSTMLAEVPTQVCSYFAMRGLKPPPPIAKPEDDEAPATLF